MLNEAIEPAIDSGRDRDQPLAPSSPVTERSARAGWAGQGRPLPKRQDFAQRPPVSAISLI
jgi:hypothetical protein